MAFMIYFLIRFECLMDSEIQFVAFSLRTSYSASVLLLFILQVYFMTHGDTLYCVNSATNITMYSVVYAVRYFFSL